MENLIVEENSVSINKTESSNTLSIIGTEETLVVTETSRNSVVIQSTEPIFGSTSSTLVMSQPETLTVVSQGARGPAGLSEDEMVYSKRIDFIGDTVVYKGEAAVGTLDTEGFWRIRKITISSLDGDIIETWAGGTSLFDKVWDSRLSYTYI